MVELNEDERKLDASSTSSSKHVLRVQLKSRRSSMMVQERKQASEQACTHAERWLRQLRQNTNRPLRVFAYMPFGQELDIVPLLMKLTQEGNEVYVPVAHQANRDMSWYVWHPDVKMQTGTYGIQEPEQTVPALSTERFVDVDVVLVPGLGFDLAGGRIGMGAGYYDRFLAKLKQERAKLPFIAALIYEWQQVESVPMETHDVPVHLIICPDGVQWTYAGIACGKER
ncbi:5-formyltetrahydrofolate cyclo-ligase [Paenibacillus sp. SC116]|uniref:5-formyltetrahydrofolate cyclo-ligase n=1 Tax=Paenibacillus sp. SC116 TaxID=2968986 RepID=UPI00215AF365|nr:5-formyltetrahydrofolate cyclo-ligase [Paenibacillus sp. SC116]MCR8844143.1 5-formyltetrahydrofolate cyclo-ligase [Paenibacillus sp. SC116]